LRGGDEIKPLQKSLRNLRYGLIAIAIVAFFALWGMGSSSHNPDELEYWMIWLMVFFMLLAVFIGLVIVICEIQRIEKDLKPPKGKSGNTTENPE